MIFLILAEFGPEIPSVQPSGSAHVDLAVVYVFRTCYCETLKKFILHSWIAFARMNSFAQVIFKMFFLAS